MSNILNIGDLIGIYEVLGEGNLSSSGRKQVRVRCTCCGFVDMWWLLVYIFYF